MIRLVAPESSRGIRLATADLAGALDASGHAAELASGLRRGDPPVFAHLGNSTRSLLPVLALRHGDLVAVHDVVARNRLLRAVLTPVTVRILSRHHVAVHSEHAAELLGSVGYEKPIHVIPPLSPVTEIEPTRVHRTRQEWRCGDYERTLISAGAIRKSKGVAELLEAARRTPSVQLVFVGHVPTRSAERLLDYLPTNVIQTEAEDLVDFCHYIAAGDALVSLRRHSVGESSGPVVQAHRLAKPVVGLRSGSLPEHCGQGDLLVDPTSSAEGLLRAALDGHLEDLASDAAQIPRPELVAAAVVELLGRVGVAG